MTNGTGYLNFVKDKSWLEAPHDLSSSDQESFVVVPDNYFVSAKAFSAASSTAGLTQVLYLKETGDSATISIDDLNQGQVGDCFLVASVGSMLIAHPGSIRNMIHANSDGTETVTLYTGQNGGVAGYYATAFQATDVVVTNSFPTGTINSAATQAMVGSQKEIWPQVVEKAIATLDGGYNAISSGGSPLIALQELTGHTADFIAPAAMSLQQLQSFIKAGDIIVMNTLHADTLPFGLYSDHSYSFEKLTGTGSSAMVQLYNPWGFYQPAPIPVTQLSKAFSEIDIGHFV